MKKNRSLGVLLIILGVLINNYAYITDIVGNTHEGLIYMGWRGAVVAVAGLVAIVLGVMALLRSPR